MTHPSAPRRRFLLRTCGAAIALVPLAALASRNDGMRASLKYQDTPQGDKKCSSCQLFVPGKSPADLGGCKVIAGDTEISPNGYCMAWAKKS